MLLSAMLRVSILLLLLQPLQVEAQSFRWEGLWSAQSSSCDMTKQIGEEADAPLKLTAQQLVGYEWSCRVAKVAKQSSAPDAWKVSLSCVQEGRSYRDELTLTLLSPVRLQMVRRGDFVGELFRCDASTTRLPEAIGFSALPLELRTRIEKVRAECKRLSDAPVLDQMQGIKPITLGGGEIDAILVDFEEICNGRIAGANCTNRACDLSIWRRTPQGWTREFQAQAYRKFVSFNPDSAHLRSIAVSIHAGDARCSPQANTDYPPGISCDLLVRFDKGRWMWQAMP